jgi:hypothetical protein
VCFAHSSNISVLSSQSSVIVLIIFLLVSLYVFLHFFSSLSLASCLFFHSCLLSLSISVCWWVGGWVGVYVYVCVLTLFFLARSSFSFISHLLSLSLSLAHSCVISIFIRLVLIPTHVSGISRLLNCAKSKAEANVQVLRVLVAGKIYLIMFTARAIRKGEELCTSFFSS